MKHKILFILKSLKNEGSNNSAILLSKKIKSSQLSICSSKNKNFLQFNNNKNLIEFKATIISKKNIFLFLTSLVKSTINFYTFFKKCNFSVIIINYVGMINIILAAVLAKKNTVIFCRENHLPKIINILLVLITNLKIAKVFTNNVYFKKKNKFIKCHYVPSPLNYDFFSYKKKSYKIIKVLSLSAIYPLKNLHKQIKFFSFLSKKIRKKIVLHHYGQVLDKNYLNKIKFLIIKYNLGKIVKLKGFKSNNYIQKEIKKYHIFFQSSKSEGISRSLMEAMQANLIPLVTNVGDTKKLIGEKHGLIFNFKNANKIVPKLKSLLRKQSVSNSFFSNRVKNLHSDSKVLNSFFLGLQRRK